MNVQIVKDAPPMTGCKVGEVRSLPDSLAAWLIREGYAIEHKVIRQERTERRA